MPPSKRLAELNITLPEVASPVGSYVPALRSGHYVFTSGQLPFRDGKVVHTGKVPDDVSVEDGCKRLEQAGADVVGMNCTRGPYTMMPILERIRTSVSCHVAGLPVPYRTNETQSTFQSLQDPTCDCIPDDRPFPVALDPFTCNRYEIAKFARSAYDMNIRYLGVCCGGAPHHVRAIAEALGRQPPASRYSPDMSKHYAFGEHPSFKQHNLDYVEKL